MSLLRTADAVRDRHPLVAGTVEGALALLAVVAALAWLPALQGPPWPLLLWGLLAPGRPGPYQGGCALALGLGADVACGLPIGTSLLPLGVVVLLAERALLPDFERWGREHLAVAATALAIGVGATGLLALVSPRLGGGGHSPGQVAQGVLVLAAVASGMFVARLLLGLRRPAGRIDPTMLGKFVP